MRTIKVLKLFDNDQTFLGYQTVVTDLKGTVLTRKKCIRKHDAVKHARWVRDFLTKLKIDCIIESGDVSVNHIMIGVEKPEDFDIEDREE